MHPKKYILFVIVLAQFCCTSLWFAGNGVLIQITEVFLLGSSALGNLTAAVQIGFISGTLLFAFLNLTDRYSPSKVFFVSAFLGALVNVTMILPQNTENSLLIIRFMTGFFLAGIYPVGMKIAADYFDITLGKSLGYLVGALVLGTAIPHVIYAITNTLSWTLVPILTSILALCGGTMVFFLVPDGPFRKEAAQFNPGAIRVIFKNRIFRKAAIGYFGHMWELYAFWAFVPFFLKAYNNVNPSSVVNVPFWSFFIIGVGSVGCIIAGRLSQHIGSRRLAGISLFLSGMCCLASPFFFYMDLVTLLIFLLFWGMVVIADSPMFSTLVANNATSIFKGTALTIVNCIGFAITIVSIQLVSIVSEFVLPQYIFLLLGIGPLLGLFALRKSDK